MCILPQFFKTEKGQIIKVKTETGSIITDTTEIKSVIRHMMTLCQQLDNLGEMDKYLE